MSSGNSQGGLLLPGPKAIRGAAAPLRPQGSGSKPDGRNSKLGGRKSKPVGRKSKPGGRKSKLGGRKSKCSISVKSRSFNGLRPTPAGSLGLTRKTRARPTNLNFCSRLAIERRVVLTGHAFTLPRAPRNRLRFVVR